MELRRIAAIDDQVQGIKLLSDSIHTYLDAEAVAYNRLPADKDKITQWVEDEAIDAVLIDHNLRKGNFSTDDGVVIAAKLFEHGKPTVLTTMHKMSDIKDSIWYGRYIPAHLMKTHMDNIENALSKAAAEIDGHISPERKAYRTIVRVENIDAKHADLVILAHNPHESISVSTRSLEERLGQSASLGMRFMAEVNIGAPTADDLFISKVEA